MTQNVLFKKIIIFCLLVCLTLPPAAESALGGNFSIEDEKELGQKFEVLITSQMPQVHDPIVLEYVRDLLHRIESAAPAQPFDLEIRVLQDNSLNAFAAPAGKVFVHNGLILAMEDESELAGVMAHELAHVTCRHIAANIERSRWISIGTLAGVLAGIFVGGGAVSQALAVGSMAGGHSAALKYSRDDEREADRLGLRYLIDAGYNPKGMADAFRNIRRHHIMGGSTGEMPEYMQTHPGLEERISEVESMLGRVDQEVLEREADNSRLRKVQMLLRARYSNPGRAKNYYQRQEDLSSLDVLGLAIAKQRSNEMEQAEKTFKKALQCGEEKALWQRETGRFYFQMGRFQEARPYLERAVKLAPNDYLALYYLSRIQAGQGEQEKAAQGLQEVLRYLPRNQEVHMALGRLLGQQGDEFAGYLHYAYANLYRGDKDRTTRYMQRAEQRADTAEQKRRFSELKEEYETVSQFW